MVGCTAVVAHRRYEALWQERTDARAAFRASHPRRNGRRVTPYPLELEVMLAFSQWFRTEIEVGKQSGISIAEDVEYSSNLPSLQAHRYKSMYAYGYHYRVKSAEESITKTCDSGVAAFFRRPCRSGRRDVNVVDANLEYIGQILEIVELNYGRHCTVLLVCDWVKANYRGRNATLKKTNGALQWRILTQWPHSVTNHLLSPFIATKYFSQM